MKSNTGYLSLDQLVLPFIRTAGVVESGGSHEIQYGLTQFGPIGAALHSNRPIQPLQRSLLVSGDPILNCDKEGVDVIATVGSCLELCGPARCRRSARSRVDCGYLILIS